MSEYRHQAHMNDPKYNWHPTQFLTLKPVTNSQLASSGQINGTRIKNFNLVV